MQHPLSYDIYDYERLIGRLLVWLRTIQQRNLLWDFAAIEHCYALRQSLFWFS